MQLHTTKILNIITDSIKDVGVGTPWISQTVTIGAVKGMQIQITATRDEDEFCDEINEDNNCIDEHAKTPEIGANCVIWCSGEPMIDRLTMEGHHEPYWEESLYALGDEDKYILL